MENKELFYEICRKYDVKLSSEQDKPTLVTNDGIKKEITKEVVQEVFPQSNFLENPYENEIFDALTSAMAYRYGTEINEDLYAILYLRYHLLSENNPMIYLFLLKDLNLSEGCTFSGTSISSGSVLLNFMDNLIFRYDLTRERKELEDLVTKIRKSVRYKVRKFKKLKEYEYFYQYFVVKEIEKEFNVKFSSPKYVPEFEHEDISLFYQRCLEERLEALIHAVRLLSDDVSFVTEEQVEDYLCKHLDLIEDGMTLVGRQVLVPDGRVDILAKDKQGTLVIIEVKVEEDKDILWQCVHYPEEIEYKERVQKVRMITFCPEYKKHMASSLKKIGYVEMYQYKPISELGKIKELDVIRFF